ncbi:unnamed protein product [Peronospora belbahrii]|uniref:Uncharacterized protein n=1 Tax=Peronospora belbahrii TaxID=622444 RepID=A0ABN8CQ37_9STRA|nr:unnamed protein product [Peronospora belbahrii]
MQHSTRQQPQQHIDVARIRRSCAGSTKTLSDIANSHVSSHSTTRLHQMTSPGFENPAMIIICVVASYKSDPDQMSCDRD